MRSVLAAVGGAAIALGAQQLLGTWDELLPEPPPAQDHCVTDAGMWAAVGAITAAVVLLCVQAWYRSLSKQNMSADGAEDKAATQYEAGSLVGDLSRMLASGEGADLLLHVGGSPRPAHSFLLCLRSPVFAAMLRHDMQESRSRSVDIPDLQEEVARQFLSFIYTDQAPLLPRLAPQLLEAANKYDLLLLKQRCEQQLSLDLCVGNAAATAVLAVLHSCSELQQHVASFIRVHAVEVMGTQGWLDVLCTDPYIAAEISQLVAAPSPPSTPSSASSASKRRTLPQDEAEKMQRKLRMAAAGGKLKELQALLAAGVDVESRDGIGETALHFAAWVGHVEAVKSLLLVGAEVNPRGWRKRTPLHRAAAQGHTTVVRLLAEASADLNARAEGGNTPLHWAAMNGEAQVAKALVEAGADSGARNETGQTPLDVIRRRNKQQLAAILR